MLRAFYDLRNCFDNQLKDVHQQLKDVHHKIDCLVQTNAELVEYYKSNTKKSNASHAPIVSIFIIGLSLYRYIIFLYTVLV
jgi:predicted  nucleic acid-binding Zn-ribbon protein